MEEWKKVANQLDKDHAKGMLSEKYPGNAEGCASGPHLPHWHPQGPLCPCFSCRPFSVGG